MIRVKVDDVKYLGNTKSYRGLIILDGYVGIMSHYDDVPALRTLLKFSNCHWINAKFSSVCSKAYPYGVEIMTHRGYWKIPSYCENFNDIAEVVVKILNSEYDLEPLMYENTLYITSLGFSKSQSQNLYETIKRCRK